MVTSNRLFVEGLFVDEQTALDEMWGVLLDRQPRNYRLMWAYEAKQAAIRMGPVVPPEYYQQLTVFGWCGKAVDELIRRCTFETAYWDDGGFDEPRALGEWGSFQSYNPGSTGLTLEDLGYAQLEEDNGLHSLFRSTQVASAVHGISFLVVDPELREGERTTDITWADAVNATGLWDARGRSLESALVVNEWSEFDSEKPSRFTLYFPGYLLEVELDGGYRVVRKFEHSFGMPVEPVMYSPFVKPYGTSRITEPMRRLQERAIKAIARLDAHMDIYAIPELILLGADESIFGDNADKWKVMMGRIKYLPDDPELAEDGNQLARVQPHHINAQSPAPHLAAINAFAKLFAREADLPDSALAITDLANPTSGDSYVESRESLISVAETATDEWKIPFRRTLRRALAVQNGSPELVDRLSGIEIKFRSPMFTSRAQAADAGSKQLASGPEWLKETRVGLELLGLETQQIRRAYQERDAMLMREMLQELRGGARGPELEDPDEVEDDEGEDDEGGES